MGTPPRAAPASRRARASAAPGRTTRQRLMPEAAANPGGYRARSARLRPDPAALWDGHLSAECSLRYNGAPACPACLGRALSLRG